MQLRQEEQMYVLYSPQKNVYVMLDPRNNVSLTTRKEIARRFTQKAGKNFLLNNMKGVVEKFRLEPVGLKDKDESQSILKVNACESIYGNSELKNLMDKLSGELSNFDLQLTDLYHFAGDHPRLSACKGYKVYRKLVAIVQKRAEVKLQMRTIQEAIQREKQPYNPRTGVYDELDKM